MGEFSILYAGIIFAVTVLTDIAYVFYIRRISEGNALFAASIGSLITFLGAVIVISYVENKLYIIPLIAGSFIGTFLAIKMDIKILRSKFLKKGSRRRKFFV